MEGQKFELIILKMVIMMIAKKNGVKNMSEDLGKVKKEISIGCIVMNKEKAIQ